MLKTIELALVAALLLTLTTGAYAESGHHESTVPVDSPAGTFPVVGLERRAETSIAYPPETVCPYLEPAGRHLIYPWWDPTVLREPDGDTLVGLTTVSFPHGDHSRTPIYLIVTQHRPDEGYLQYQVLWGDFELQRITITCRGDGGDGTHATWLERNAGLHERGVPAVTDYIEGGHVEQGFAAYGQRIAEAIEAGNPHAGPAAADQNR